MLFFISFAHLVYFIICAESSSTENLALPVSIPAVQMKKIGDMDCTFPVPCPDRATPYEGFCGEVCRGREDGQLDLGYTFHGDKFQVYGVSGPDMSEYTIYLDNMFYTTVTPYSPTQNNYALHYTSPPIEYGEHAIRISGKGEKFGFYKFAYWPSYKAIRFNITEMDGDGWTSERDTFGGVRAYPSGLQPKYKEIGCSKAWIFGSFAQFHGEVVVSLDDKVLASINTLATPTTRNDFALIYETESFNLAKHKISLKKRNNGICISYVYVLPTVLPPKITPRAIPFSIPPTQMTIEGNYATSSPTNCATGGYSSGPLNPICGPIYYPSTDIGIVSYSYTFHGEKFQVFGSATPTSANFDIYLDNVLLATIYPYDNVTVHYAHLYTSDTFDYGEHTVKITGKGPNFKFHKISYWPAVQAVRYNITDFSQKWTVEHNTFGGLREYTQDSTLIKSKAFNLSKVWIIGTVDTRHGDLEFSLGDQTETLHTNNDRRKEFVLIHETEVKTLNEYTLSFKRKDGEDKAVGLDCIFYYPESYPQQASIPVSVPIKDMIKTSNRNCETPTPCPDNNQLSLTPCGETCSGNNEALVSYAFTFWGDKFQVYGTSEPNSAEYTVYLDNFKLATVTPYSATTTEYALQYTSPQFEYGEHTVRVTGKGQNFKFYKIAYWPSYQAIRLNISNMDGTGWTDERDTFGGLRSYPNNDTPKTATINASKIWIVGSYFDRAAGPIKLTIDDTEIITETTYIKSGRKDFRVLYQSDPLELKEHDIKIQREKGGVDITLNCIFYLPVEPPKPTPLPPVADPIWIPIKAMIVNSPLPVPITPIQCPVDQEGFTDSQLPNKTVCGPVYGPTTDDGVMTFSYTFLGEKFQVFGVSDSDSSGYNLTLDNVLIGTIYPFSFDVNNYDLHYTSEKIAYGEHTVKVTGKGTHFKFYKFTYWPSIKAKSLNIAEFENVRSHWTLEHDHFGYLRAYTSTNQAITATLGISRIWLIGTIDPNHGTINLSLNGGEVDINSTGSTRKELVVLHDEQLPSDIYTVGLSSKSGDIGINGIYYMPDFVGPNDEDYDDETGRLNKVEPANSTTVKIELANTTFQNTQYTIDGAAIHLINVGFKGDNIQIETCKTTANGGGIYIHNTIDGPNEISLHGLKIKDCQADNGAAIYVYASCKQNRVEIVDCTFDGNEASTAGSAIYASFRNGTISSCNFLNNKGTAPLVKIYNVFPSNAMVLDMSNDLPIAISNSQFASYSGSSISVSTDIFAPRVEVYNCQFNGMLNEDSHYIDGTESSSEKLSFIGCSFENEMKAISFKSNMLKNDRHISNFLPDSWKFISVTIGSLLVVITVITIIITKSRNTQEDNEEA